MRFFAFGGLFSCAVVLATADSYTQTTYSASADDSAQHVTAATVVSGALDLATTLGLSESAVASAVPLTELPRRPSFAHEQCGNACRIVLDKGIVRCDGYRQPSDGPERPNCRAELYAAYESCVRACPPDTGGP